LTYFGLKYTIIGTVMLMGGIAFLAAEVSDQGFLWGALYSGIWGILAPFVLIFLGVALIYLDISDFKERHRKLKKASYSIKNHVRHLLPPSKK
jgi:hypothetical protein